MLDFDFSSQISYGYRTTRCFVSLFDCTMFQKINSLSYRWEWWPFRLPIPEHFPFLFCWPVWYIFLWKSMFFSSVLAFPRLGALNLDWTQLITIASFAKWLASWRKSMWWNCGQWDMWRRCLCFKKGTCYRDSPSSLCGLCLHRWCLELWQHLETTRERHLTQREWKNLGREENGKNWVLDDVIEVQNQPNPGLLFLWIFSVGFFYLQLKASLYL